MNSGALGQRSVAPGPPARHAAPDGGHGRTAPRAIRLSTGTEALARPRRADRLRAGIHQSHLAVLDLRRGVQPEPRHGAAGVCLWPDRHDFHRGELRHDVARLSGGRIGVFLRRASASAPLAGFLAGWALLLDYMLMPTLIYVLCAIAIEALVPGIPRVLSIIVVLCFNTGISLLGIKASARLNAVMLAVMLAFLGLFFVLGINALAHGVAGRTSIYRAVAAARGIQLRGDLQRPVGGDAEFPRLRRHHHAVRGGARRMRGPSAAPS